MNNEEQRMSPEDRVEKDACRWKHFDRICYGTGNDDEYHKKIDDKLTDEEYEKALEIGKTLRVEKIDGEIKVWFDNEIAKRGVEAHRAMEKRLREGD